MKQWRLRYTPGDAWHGALFELVLLSDKIFKENSVDIDLSPYFRTVSIYDRMELECTRQMQRRMVSVIFSRPNSAYWISCRFLIWLIPASLLFRSLMSAFRRNSPRAIPELKQGISASVNKHTLPRTLHHFQTQLQVVLNGDEYVFR